jgi:lipopolysaccharide transport system permease protein
MLSPPEQPPSEQTRWLSEGEQPVAATSASGTLRPQLSSQVWVIEPRGGSLAARARELWVYRHLFRYFMMNTIRRLYHKTVLGWLWLFIRPLLPAIALMVIFHRVGGMSTGDDTPYFLFLLVGMGLWSTLSESLMWMTRSFQINGAVLKKLYFPRLLLPAAAVGPAVVNLAIMLGLILVVDLYFYWIDGRLWIVPRPELSLAPIALLLTLLLAFSIGLFTSVLGAEYRDVRLTLSYVLQFWFLLTPIVYPLSAVPESYRWLAALNPMTLNVQLFKWAFFGIGDELAPTDMIAPLVILVVLFFLGLWFFIKVEATAVDRM